ncbi:MAG TPA: patatin-like phospholipase family protein [Acidimicrobiales bacterium]|nr:patatin-like phospholipase family protein [Acidimicrobiales bacterium]
MSTLGLPDGRADGHAGDGHAGDGHADGHAGDGHLGDGAGNHHGGEDVGRTVVNWSERLRARWDRRRHAAGGRQVVTPQRTAFVLAGGGSRGAVQVGMLDELVRRGIRADRVFGASVGAINGAAYAGNPTPEGIEHMADVWRGIRGTDIFPRGTFDGPWAWFLKRAAVHANTGLRRIIEAGVRFEYLEDAMIPVEVVTTSLTDGRERWIAHGPAVEAILASSAIPSIFPPVTIDGDVLVDGGVVNNVPISRALTAGCDRIYVLLCGPLHYHPKAPRRPAEAALTAFFVAVHARFVRELAALPPAVEVVVFSGGGDPSGQFRDFSATAALIEEGRAEVADVLDRYVGTSHDLGIPPAGPPPAPARTVLAAGPSPSPGPGPDSDPAPTEPAASP